MKKVFERLIRIGYTYATIGVEPEVEANVRLYRRLGFNEEVKTMHKDYCDVDNQFQPVPCSTYLLLKKRL